MRESWVPPPVQHKLAVGACTAPVIPALGGQRQEEEEFKAMLGYIASQRPAWTTWDPILKYNNKTKVVVG